MVTPGRCYLKRTATNGRFRAQNAVTTVRRAWAAKYRVRLHSRSEGAICLPCGDRVGHFTPPLRRSATAIVILSDADSSIGQCRTR